MSSTLNAHLATGITSVCRCWAVTPSGGAVLGFTDHDRDLAFDGMSFRADTGMTARALQQGTGLAVDNTEAIGVLSDPAIREADIAAGRYDGAEVQAWLVNWQNPDQRRLEFRGRLGEITRTGAAFRAELRGLADALNEPRGRVYQSKCAAVLGDAACGFDTGAPGYSLEADLTAVSDRRILELPDPAPFEAGWFRRGRLDVLDGAAAGLSGVVKSDEVVAPGMRRVALWEDLRAPVAPGDRVRVVAGCDKRAATCRDKFSNFLNFRGFPTIPGEDWLMSYPRSGDANDGGSLS